MRKLLLLLFVFSSLWAFGQMPEGVAPSSSRLGTDSLTIDSSIAVYFARDPFRKSVFEEPLLDNLEEHHPARQGEYDYIHLGNNGAPAKPFFLDPFHQVGFDLGFHSFDYYQKKREDIPFYKLGSPYSRVSFSQGSRQPDSYVSAEFADEIGGIGVLMSYDRLNQLGVYDFEKNRHDRFTGGLHYTSKSQQYQLIFSLARNRIKSQENGGIVYDSIFSILGNTPVSVIDVWLSDARTTNSHLDMGIDQFWVLNNGLKKDSLSTPLFNWTASHRASFAEDSYKYYDTNPVEDYYGNYYTNSVGIRNYTRSRQLKNGLFLMGSPGGSSNKLIHKTRFEIGLEHTFFWVIQEPESQNYQNLLVKGKGDLPISKQLNLEAKVELGLLRNAGDYLLEGELRLGLKELGVLEASVASQSQSPSLVKTRIFVSQTEMYNNDFRKENSNRIGAKWSLPKHGLSIGFKNSVLDNYIYFDQQSLPAQSEEVINLLQVYAKGNLKYKAFHLDNTLLFQAASGNEIRLPELVAKHSLYFEGKVFKKAMLSRMGMDIRYQTAYFGDNYNPIIGQFYLQDETELPLMPGVDVFWSFAVKSFRAYVKYENLLYFGVQNSEEIASFVGATGPGYLVPNYPLRDPDLRFGITWRFYN